MDEYDSPYLKLLRGYCFVSQSISNVQAGIEVVVMVLSFVLFARLLLNIDRLVHTIFRFDNLIKCSF